MNVQESPAPAEINSLEDAFNVASQEASPQAKEEPKSDAQPEQPKETPSPEANTRGEDKKEDSLETPPELDKTGMDKLSPEHQAELDKRVRGYQASYTKKVQALQQAHKAKEAELESKYESKFKEALSVVRPGDSNQKGTAQTEPSSIDELFKGANPEQVRVFKQAMKMAIDEGTASLRQENEKLKSYVDSVSFKEESIAMHQKAVSKFPELAKPEVLTDLTIWAESNPELVRGKSIEEMYMLKTYDERFEQGKRIAEAELKRKTQSLVETSSVNNTIDTEEVDDLEAAFAKALQEHKTTNK